MTGGRGPDACIDAVGMEAHGHDARRRLRPGRRRRPVMETDRPHVAAPGDPLLPQGRHGLHPRRLRRLRRQDPDRRRYEQGPDASRSARPTCSATCPSCLQRIEQGEIDPSLRHHPSRCRSRRRPHALPDVPRQEGRLHQGRAQAGRPSVTVASPPRRAFTMSGGRR